MKDYRNFGFEEAFDFLDLVMNGSMEPLSKIPEVLLSGTFPPANLFQDKDGNLIYEFAVAGYNDEEISLEFRDDRMILSLSPKESSLPEGMKMIQKGIRSAKSKVSAFVPPSKFDVEKTILTLEKGILAVKVPVKENAKPLIFTLKK